MAGASREVNRAGAVEVARAWLAGKEQLLGWTESAAEGLRRQKQAESTDEDKRIVSSVHDGQWAKSSA